MIQGPRKSNGIELSYERADELPAREPPSEGEQLEEGELAHLHAQLRQVREWADRGEWRESGSDGLYAILSSGGRTIPPGR